MKNPTIRTLLLARADAATGGGKRTGTTPAITDHPADSIANHPSVRRPGAAPAEADEADLVDSDPDAVALAVRRVDSPTTLAMFVAAAKERGHVVAPKILTLKEGQGVLGAFVRVGIMTYAPKLDEVIAATKLGEVAQPRTGPSIVLEVLVGADQTMLVEIPAAYSMRRPLGIHGPADGPWSTDLLTAGQELTITRGATKQLAGTAKQVTDYMITIQAPK